MKSVAIRLCVATLLSTALLPTHAHAHHSRAPFQLDQTVVVTTKVKSVSWSNPHTYFVGDVINSQGKTEEWTFEGHSISGLTRLGWTKDTLKAGDVVKMIVNVHRDPTKRFALIDHVVMADGAKHYSAGQAPQAANRAPIKPSNDFSGNWRFKFPGTPEQVRARILAGPQPPPTDLPYTPKGKEQLKLYSDKDNPAYVCGSLSLPYLLMTVYEYKWKRLDDRVLIEKEHQDNANRIIYLKQKSKPANYKPNPLGFSVGRFEDDTFIVETDGFNAVRWGNGYGMDSSAQKKIVERYKLTNGGMGLSLTYTVEDPVYFTKPITVQGDFVKAADVDFVKQPPCDPKIAHKHLEFE